MVIINKMNLKLKLKKLNIIIISSLILNYDNLFADVNLLNLDDVPAQCAAVIDLETGRLLYGKNENKRAAMASTTKIMTALITLEQDNLDSYFEVDPDAIKVEGTSMGLLAGDKVSLRSLAVGMLLPSGNDAAQAAAIKIAGNKNSFLNIMNEKASLFGCTNTNFATTSGLDDKNHYSTASDMAKIARRALLNDDFAKICQQQYMTIEYGNPPYKRTLKNHNKLLSRYDYCVGVKTGFTDDAGRCLVSAAKKDGLGLIVVTLKSANICESHLDVYQQAFEKLSKYTPSVKLPVNNIKVVGGEIVSVPIEKQFETKIPVIDGEIKKISNKIKLKKFLFAPIRNKSVVGEIDYYIENKKIAVEPIITSMEVRPEEKNNFFNKIFKNIKK
ncbi:MAG: D-alanyl-D-alanine carboxypeptidase [Oscillospiraceae bacterium]|nr:D-alanyl-D-alanine carboxypeptidase [Oscillospiraceae bacterium]